MTDYDSRRTGNGLLDTGSTPVWSIDGKRNKGVPYVYTKRPKESRSLGFLMEISF